MCAYCNMGDWHFKYDPPWPNRSPFPNSPFIPAPIMPTHEHPLWDLAKLREFEDLMKRVKALEDAAGCPSEPNKADYLGMLRQRIEMLEKAAKGAAPAREP